MLATVTVWHNKQPIAYSDTFPNSTVTVTNVDFVAAGDEGFPL